LKAPLENRCSSQKSATFFNCDSHTHIIEELFGGLFVVGKKESNRDTFIAFLGEMVMED